MQHQRFFKNSVLPGTQQRNNHFVGSTENFYYNNGNVNYQNGVTTPYNQSAMQMNLASNSTNFGNFGSGGRQRFTPYYNRRSYAHALKQSSNQPRHNNFTNQMQSQIQSNLFTITEQGSLTSSPNVDSSNGKRNFFFQYFK